MTQPKTHTSPTTSARGLLSLAHGIACCSALTVLTGCTTIYRMDNVPQVYPNSEKIGIPVALVLKPDFCNTICRWRLAFGEPRGIAIGQPLAASAETVVRAVFKDVIVVRQQEGTNMPPGVVVLTPKVTRTYRGIAGSGWTTVPTIVSIEWSLAAADGQLICVKDCIGTGASMFGGLSMESASQRGMKAALADLFAKSYQVLSTAPEIKAFAGTWIGAGKEKKP